MKPTILILISVVIVFFYGCQKDSSSSGSSPSLNTSKITITAFQKSTDSVRISWTGLNVSNFEGYSIIRRSYKATDTTAYNYEDIIGTVGNQNTTTYLDVEVPSAAYLEYQIMGTYYSSITHLTSQIYSNVRSYERPELKTFVFNLKDVLQDAINHRLYVIDNDSGKISVLDYNLRQITHQIYTYATLGYSSLGTYNGTEELYVPRNDGWIYIYDANTLTKTDQVKAGTNCYAVVYNNGKLFIVADTSSYTYALKVIDRATKSLITRTGITEEPTNLVLVPGSNTKLFGIGYDWLFSFEYDANGHYVSWNEVNYNYSSYGTYFAFNAFPNGQGLITSSTGAIYTNSLNLLQNLPYGNNEYSSFTFNSPFTSVFAGCSNYQHVMEYTSPGYSELNAYPCLGYPAAVFVDAGNLIVLSNIYSSSWYGDPSEYYLESIPLVKKK